MSHKHAKIYAAATPAWYDIKRAREIVEAYNSGGGSGQPADRFIAESVVPAGTGSFRDFSYIAPDVPQYHAENCVACMDCVQNCPDSAIFGKVMLPDVLEAELARVTDAHQRDFIKDHWVETTKFHKTYQKKHEKDASQPKGAMFGIFVDPTKCKGCGECVVACGEHESLSMVKKTRDNLPSYQAAWAFYRDTPATPDAYISPRLKVDIMLKDSANLYVGGGGSCMGCGEASVIRQIMAITYEKVGHKCGIIAATGCNTVYSSTYPYNTFMVPWTNS
ncbi:MAG: thiamine pyrophosphate-binding protein, partial [Magnetococcus sp. WYHC-3]